jgi:hypothetical protein
MLEAVVDVANDAEPAQVLNGPQLQIGRPSIEGEPRGKAENVTEGGNKADSGYQYPRRSNQTNVHFTCEIDE